VPHAVLVATLLTVPVLVERAYAHHGAGLHDMRKNVELEGRLTRVLNRYVRVNCRVIQPRLSAVEASRSCFRGIFPTEEHAWQTRMTGT
jgi:hypothetical protein